MDVSASGVKQMNTHLKAIAAAAVLSLALGGMAAAQSSSSQTTSGSATIIQPITLTKSTDLAFGKIVRPSSGTNTVSVDEATGARATVGGGNATLLASTVSRAAYAVAGEGGQTFSISMPASFNMTRAGGAETLTVTLAATAASGTLSGSLGSAGSASFGVGGSVPLSSSTATGAYTGTFDVTVAYN